MSTKLESHSRSYETGRHIDKQTDTWPDKQTDWGNRKANRDMVRYTGTNRPYIHETCIKRNSNQTALC